MTEPRGDDDAGLDELLAAARWPAMDEAVTERLHATLRATSRRRIVPVAWIATAAAAAVVVVVTLVARPGSVEPSGRDANVTEGIEDRGVVGRPTEVGTPKEEAPRAPGAPVFVRDANTYERMMFAVLSAPPRAEATPARSAIDVADVRRTLRAQLARPGASLDATALAAFARESTSGAADVALLMRCARRADARRVVLGAVAARDDRAGVDLLIRLVLDRATRDDALAAVGRHASPATVDALLARLAASPRVDDRLAAARAVGATCDPRALDLLLGMVEVGRSRREALAAILSCDSPEARQLVARLRRDASTAAQLVAIRAELDSLFS